MNMTTQGLEKISFPLSESDSFKDLCSVFLDNIQDIDDTLQVILDETLDTAEGEQLKRMGEKVGHVFDDSLTDDQNRLLIKIRIIWNTSTMTVNDILSILSTVFTAKILYFDNELFRARFDIERLLEDWQHECLMRFPAPLGIPFAGLHYDKNNCFSFLEDSTGLGFGDSNNSVSGGKWASIIEYSTKGQYNE